MLPNEQKKSRLFLASIYVTINSVAKYQLCELLKTSLFRFCILYLWDLCSQGQAMCYATLTAQIPQIFCNQAKKEEVCRWKPAFCYFPRIVQCYVNQISLNYLPRNVLRGIERLLCLILPRKSAFMGDLTEELSQIFYNIAFIAACTPFF